LKLDGEGRELVYKYCIEKGDFFCVEMKRRGVVFIGGRGLKLKFF